MYKIYARRSTDFTGIDFLDDVEAIDTVDHTYAAVVKTANKPVVVYSSSGSVKSSNAQYRVDDWSSATAHTPPGITGLVLGACTPMTGVMLGVILVTSSMELYSILSMDQWGYMGLAFCQSNPWANRRVMPVSRKDIG